jgi:hypothetical protein
MPKSSTATLAATEMVKKMACAFLLHPYSKTVPMISGSQATVLYLVALAAASANGHRRTQPMLPSRILTAAYKARTRKNSAIGSNVAAAPRCTTIPHTANRSAARSPEI